MQCNVVRCRCGAREGAEVCFTPFFFCLSMTADVNNHNYRFHTFLLHLATPAGDVGQVRSDCEEVCGNGEVSIIRLAQLPRRNAAARGSRKLMQYISLLGATDRTKCILTSFSALSKHPSTCSTRCKMSVNMPGQLRNLREARTY